MRRFLLPFVATLVLAPATARAIDPGSADSGGGASAAAIVEPQAPDSSAGITPVTAPVFAERPSRVAPNEVEFIRAFTDRWGIPCREYVQRVFIGDAPVEASGTVCRGADGSWRLRQ